MVAREDEHIVGVVHIDKADVLEDGVGRALVPRSAVRALIRRQDMYAAVGAVKIPRLAGANVAVELQRAVLRQHAHGVDAGIGAVRERKIDDAELAAERHGGLCHVLCEHIEPAALPAGKQHGDTFFFHAVSLLLLVVRRACVGRYACLFYFPDSFARKKHCAERRELHAKGLFPPV